MSIVDEEPTHRINRKGSRVDVSPPARQWLLPLLTSSVGSKILTALTGIVLTGFVIGHLIGNLKLFWGPESINSYAQFLKSTGPLLWIARLGLLAALVLHMTLAIRLKRRAVAARPVAYRNPATVQATIASRTMIWTGIVIFVFLIIHLAHFTFGIFGMADGVKYLDLKDDKGRHDVYRMVVAGFSVPAYALIYLLAQVALFLHLRHGVASVFQTLSLNGTSCRTFLNQLAIVVAAFVTVGNSLIVFAVWGGLVTDTHSLFWEASK